jgi:HPr kinase/phosphorylase
MAAPRPPSIHASAVLAGSRAVLIRGPAASGKSRLALALLQSAQARPGVFARLVADDRTCLEAAHGRLLARPAPELAGLLEIRGLGIRRLPHEPVAVVGLVVDLAAEAQRLPLEAERTAQIEGVTLRHLAVPATTDPLPLVFACLDAGSLVA